MKSIDFCRKTNGKKIAKDCSILAVDGLCGNFAVFQGMTTHYSKWNLEKYYLLPKKSKYKYGKVYIL